jgi:polyhydroxyalkanoate synthesis regulator phasin
MAAKMDLSDIPFLAVGAVVALQEEVEKAAERLVDKGKSLTPEGRKKMAGAKKGLISKGDEFSTVVAKTVQRALENTGIVTHADLGSIEKRVTDIEKKVATRKKPAAKKPAAKKKAAKKPAAAKKKAAKKPAAKKKAAKKPARKAAKKSSESAAIKSLLSEPKVADEKALPAAEPAPVLLSELVPRRPEGE